MGDLQEIPGGEEAQVPKVKQKGPFLEEKGNKQSGIGKGVVNQPGMKGGSHGRFC